VDANGLGSDLIQSKTLLGRGRRQIVKTRLCALPVIKDLNGLRKFLAEPERWLGLFRQNADLLSEVPAVVAYARAKAWGQTEVFQAALFNPLVKEVCRIWRRQASS
jgi:hypothetical protein